MTSRGRGESPVLERRTVSRKTPGDGKLEITAAAAAALEPLGSRFPAAVDARVGEARLGTMPCTCRGADRPHVHHFVESDLFRALSPGTEVDVVLDAAGGRLLILTA